MSGRRTAYEIYWEVLVYCRSPRSFTAIISRCDLNSKTGQEYLDFLVTRGYLAVENDDGRARYHSTEQAGDYIRLFTRLYQDLFGSYPAFRL